MTVLRRVLALVIAVEVLSAGLLAVRATSRVPVPLPDLSRFDAQTAADLRRTHAELKESDAASWQQLADVYLAFGCLPESEVCFRRAAELDPRSGEILYGWASCLDRMGRLDESNVLYARAAPSLPPALSQSSHYRIGRNHLRKEDIEAANAAFLTAGDLPSAVYLRAKNLLRSGKVAEAGALQDALRRQPPTIQTLLLEAEWQRAQGHLSDSLTTLHKLDRVTNRIDLNDQNKLLGGLAAQHGLLGRLNRCTQRNDTASQADCVLAAIAGHPQEYVYLPRAAEMLINIGRFEQALSLLQQAHQSGSLSPPLLELMGDLLQELNRSDEARAHWLQAAAMGETPTVFGKLADLSRAEGDDAAARRYAARQREAEGVAAYRNDALDVAIDSLQKAVAQNPAASRAWFYLGEAHRAQGETAAARRAYENCLQENPEHGRAATALSHLLNASPDATVDH